MGRRRKPDPVKCCEYCSAKLERKRYGDSLEDMTRFMQRRFCNINCMGLKRTSETPTRRTMYKRAGVVKKTSCEHCGVSTNLDIHHIDENPTNNAPENIKTLCDSCHTKLHWQTGKSARPKASCVVCGRDASRRGYCQKHWFRLEKYGDPLLTKKSCGPFKAPLVRVSSNE